MTPKRHYEINWPLGIKKILEEGLKYLPIFHVLFDITLKRQIISGRWDKKIFLAFSEFLNFVTWAWRRRECSVLEVWRKCIKILGMKANFPLAPSAGRGSTTYQDRRKVQIFVGCHNNALSISVLYPPCNISKNGGTCLFSLMPPTTHPPT